MSTRRSRFAQEEHSGAWKVAFADLCLVLMCLFVVMWILERRVFEAPSPADSQATSTQQPAWTSSSSTSASPSDAQQLAGETAREFPRGQFESPADMARLAAAVQQLSEIAKLSDHVSTAITPDGLRVRLADSDERGMFERGSAVPSPGARALLTRIGGLLSGVENSLMIVGHTDAVRYRTTAADGYTNWHLSSERALAARTALVAGGLELDRVLMAVGMADHAPLLPDDPVAAANRRIEFVVLTKARAMQMAQMFSAPHAGEMVLSGQNAAADATEIATLPARLTNDGDRSPDSSEP
ncbi:chemotaxis lafU protein [Pandoraea horticolens]|uniref:Chemotaxis lafU protein n=1 Tax=Pandoraea horticolens TaxID=2508298 RepID=A0A5E4SAZ1_9BURK|nr:flagellar motor protein MotB [Pandoraea horticolens]VVD71378.1 chemotaxis lafU protein [Pandoraea horticolens]